MRINVIGYYIQHNGYGRFTSRIIKAMQDFGVNVNSLTQDDIDRPQWMLDMMGVNWNDLTITISIPKSVKRVPGRHWLFTMCEGELLSSYLMRKIHKSGVERVIVPCEHNRQVFLKSGLKLPIDVVPLGTDPDEFPLLEKEVGNPYTFLTIADRGNRKGWTEVYDAFYRAFGGKTTGEREVRLIIKDLFPGNPLINMLLKKTDNMDPRLVWDRNRYDNIADLFSQVDCVVLPSRSEGWGLPHREAAMMGLPVILQKYAGLDDGHTEEWAICVEGGHLEEIPTYGKAGGSGNWLVADPVRVAEEMLFAFENPEEAQDVGHRARGWLSFNQTWMDSAAVLIGLIHDRTGWDYGNKVEPRSGSEIRTTNGRVHESSNLIRT